MNIHQAHTIDTPEHASVVNAGASFIYVDWWARVYSSTWLASWAPLAGAAAELESLPALTSVDQAAEYARATRIAYQAARGELRRAIIEYPLPDRDKSAVSLAASRACHDAGEHMHRRTREAVRAVGIEHAHTFAPIINDGLVLSRCVTNTIARVSGSAAQGVSPGRAARIALNGTVLSLLESADLVPR